MWSENLTEDKKNHAIAWMSKNLPEFRNKVGMTQEEIANLIGISRQRYSSIENGKEEMTWGVFLSLLFVFENSESCRRVIDEERDEIGFVYQAMNGPAGESSNVSIEINGSSIINNLDEQARANLSNLLKIEQARCEASKKSE